MTVHLRAVQADDLPIFFADQCDAGAAAMVGFTPRPRDAFDAHWRRILADPATKVMTIDVDGVVAGYVSAFPRGARREIAYWLGRAHWGRGIGGLAVEQFLALHPDRPLHAIVAATNPASMALLTRCGFAQAGEETAADGWVERLFRLD